MMAVRENGLRGRKRETTRRRLEDACAELARARGIQKMSVRYVCERVLVSEGTFFNYFGDKDGALGSWARRWLAGLIAPASAEGERMAAGRAALRGELRSAARRVVQAISGDVAFQRELWGRVRLSAAEHPDSALCQRVRSAQEAGEIRADLGPDELAGLIRGGLEVTLAGWAGNAAREPASVLAPRLQAALDLILDGARKRNERVRPGSGLVQPGSSD